MSKLQIALFFFLLTPLALFATEPDVIINAHFIKMQVEENGKKTNSNMIVDLFVVKQDGQKSAAWNSVFVMPDTLEGKKKTVLRADHYSTENGGIENLVIQGQTVSFDLNRSPGRKVKIICTKKSENKYDIMGKSFYWSSLLKKNFTEIWSITDKIILPSLEVYGQGD
jgi:hypothetical protein